MSTATSVFQQIRDFIFELRPMMLDDLGVTPTLKRYVEAKKEKSLVDNTQQWLPAYRSQNNIKAFGKMPLGIYTNR